MRITPDTGILVRVNINAKGPARSEIPSAKWLPPSAGDVEKVFGHEMPLTNQDGVWA
jgi:hypothetical protein